MSGAYFFFATASVIFALLAGLFVHFEHNAVLAAMFAWMSANSLFIAYEKDTPND